MLTRTQAHLSLFALTSAIAVTSGAMFALEPALFAQQKNAAVDRRQRNAEGLPASFHTLAQQAGPSIVAIEATGNGMQGLSCRSRGRGLMHTRSSGFVIEPGNVIVTNSHLLAGADRVRILTRDGVEYRASSMSIDPLTDLAVIRMAAPFDLPGLPLADSDAANLGDWVLAVGNPWRPSRGSDMNLSAGIITGRGPLPDYPGNTDFLRTNAMLTSNHGGGPLLNLNGEVVGLNTVSEDSFLAPTSSGFALPSNQMNWVTRELLEHGAVRRSYLGIKTAPLKRTTHDDVNVPPGKGVLVTQVQPGSPAAGARLLTGDIMVALDQRELLNPPQLHALAERLEPGQTYPLDVIRNGDKTSLDIVPVELKYPARLAPRTIQLETLAADTP